MNTKLTIPVKTSPDYIIIQAYMYMYHKESKYTSIVYMCLTLAIMD